MSEFVVELNEEFMNTFSNPHSKHKNVVARSLKKNFKLGKDYICKKRDQSNSTHGGHNRIDFFLTTDAAEKLKHCYNLKHAYIRKLDNLTFTPILMSLENSTVGFICQCLQNITETKRQFIVGRYKVDLYIPYINLVVECDEEGHLDYNENKEIARQTYIEDQLKCTFHRFNPNDPSYDISDSINLIMKKISDVKLLKEKENMERRKMNSEESCEKKNDSDVKNGHGPLVQMYDACDLSKVKDYFFSIMEALREIPKNYGENYRHVNRSRIVDAFHHRTEYLGHRWHFLDRSQISSIHVPCEIGETRQSRQQKKGYIAILDRNETLIKNVFSKNADVAKHLGIKSVSLISTAINHKDGCLSNHDDIKVRMWEDVDNLLQTQYLESNSLPAEEKRAHGKKIAVLDAHTKELVEVMSCIDAVCKKYKVSPKTVKQKMTCWDTDEGIYNDALRFQNVQE